MGLKKLGYFIWLLAFLSIPAQTMAGSVLLGDEPSFKGWAGREEETQKKSVDQVKPDETPIKETEESSQVNKPSVENQLRRNAINFYGLFVLSSESTSGSVFLAEYERLLAPKASIFIKGGGLQYKYDESSYHEKGDGPGFDIGARFYPSGNGLKWFYVGGSMGYWDINWDADNYGSKRSGSSSVFNIGVDLGVKIPLWSSNFTFNPAVQVGDFVSLSNCNSSACSRIDGAYGIIGGGFGVQF